MDNQNEIIYRLADGKQIRLKVNIAVKELLEQTDRQIRSQRRQDRRHIDFYGYVTKSLENFALPNLLTNGSFNFMSSNEIIESTIEPLYLSLDDLLYNS